MAAGFCSNAFYKIIATMPAETTKEQFELMLQTMLAERFHLVFHYDTMSAAGYVLVPDKGGVKLKEVAPEAETVGTTGADGFPIIAGTRMLGWKSGTTHQRVKYQEWPMSAFLTNLSFLIGRSLGKSLDDGFLQPRVVNKTGLAGKYTNCLEI